MTHSTGSQNPSKLDFAEIEAAVMETQRGRWFLGEYARRNRICDTAMLLEAISRLEKNVVSTSRPVEESSAFRAAICDMAEEIERAKREIAELAPGGAENVKIAGASAELDSIVDSTETATSSILEAAEAVQELAWTLREEGVSDACCDALDLHATEIYTACSFQDITGQRITKVVGVLQMLDNRIGTMAQLWHGGKSNTRAQGDAEEHPEADLLNGPALEGEAIDQDEVDRMMLGDAMTAEAAITPLDPGEEPAGDLDEEFEEELAEELDEDLESDDDPDDDLDEDLESNDDLDEDLESDDADARVPEGSQDLALDTIDTARTNGTQVAGARIADDLDADTEAADDLDAGGEAAGDLEAGDDLGLSQKDFDALFA